MAETIGKYEVIRTAGKGATAVVYLARDPDAQREVAIKLDQVRRGQRGDVTPSASCSRPRMQSRGGLTIRTSSKIYDAVVEADQAYLVMECIERLPRSISIARSIVCCPCIE